MASRGENEGFTMLDEFIAEALAGQTGSDRSPGRAVNEGAAVLAEFVVDLGQVAPGAEAVRRVEAAIRDLPTTQRELYLLALAGASVGDLAARFSLTAQVVRDRLGQARAFLGEKLRAAGG